jgi:hypothetical protein
MNHEEHEVHEGESERRSSMSSFVVFVSFVATRLGLYGSFLGLRRSEFPVPGLSFASHCAGPADS